MNTRVVKCGICGKPYQVFSMYAGDQSACPACVAEAQKAVSRPSGIEEIMKRKQYYGND